MAESFAPWAVLSNHGCVHLDSAPASVFLKTSPHGAYTTTRTGNEGEYLLLWTRHLRRLSQSMEVLASAMPDRFPHPPSTFSGLQNLVKPSLQAGLQRALPLRRSGEELNVTILASTDGHSDRLTWDVSVHLSNYVPRSPPIPAHIAVLGSGRDLPLAKYSLWASAREPLEKAKPPGATEIVLSNDGDGLLEGSVTNFFVVAMNPDVEVQTAALGDGVLPGVIRQLVIEVCEEYEIPVREVMPSWQARGTWIESFVTSSLRMVQPVESIRMCQPWVPPQLLEDPEWDEVRFDRIASVTERIRSRVLQRALDEGLPVREYLR
ncbi:hypothetical protein M758_1G052300 [Ceratodon purpureus]|nr:hypothetical protein M758_1G052300 [Ceratodon purpureus]